jgi:hypothetical protein
MNRHAALGKSNDTISHEGSGNEEWSRRMKSNNSLNPTRLSMSFINLGWWDLPCVIMSAVGLIRALDTLRLVNARNLCQVVSRLRCLRANPLCAASSVEWKSRSPVSTRAVSTRSERRERHVAVKGGLTTGSTRPLDSFPFIVIFLDNVEGCSLAAGYPGRSAAR